MIRAVVLIHLGLFRLSRISLSRISSASPPHLLSRISPLANASHYIFQSNEADVLREIGSFITSLH